MSSWCTAGRDNKTSEVLRASVVNQISNKNKVKKINQKSYIQHSFTDLEQGIIAAMVQLACWLDVVIQSESNHIR